ncbi:MAG: ferritin-like domain-containing protein [Hyphomicrobiaceae bacterium]
MIEPPPRAATTLDFDPPKGLPGSLALAARAIVGAVEPLDKVGLAKASAAAWQRRQLSLGARATLPPMPDRPGRPVHPQLLMPRDMPKRSTQGDKGRIALLHALAHIELNAVDMTWDLIGRFIGEAMPLSFFENWVQVGLEEACHFAMVTKRLSELGAAYGDLPAHDGLWQAAQATGGSLMARLAVVPLVLEARGLDVTPSMISSLLAAGDTASAAVLEVIYRDEKKHVAFGAKWFRFMCEAQGLAPEPTFHDLVRRHFRGPVKPPFNDKARSEAGLTPGFYKPLMAVARMA